MIVFLQGVDSKTSTLVFGVLLVSASTSVCEASAPQGLSHTRHGHDFEKLGSRQHNSYPALGYAFKYQLILSIICPKYHNQRSLKPNILPLPVI